MAKMVTIKVDGRQITAPAGTTILEAAKDANIYIPHLCSNEELAPYGACRLCLVEISHGGRARLVASCTYEVAEGLEVKTNTERVLNVRRLVIELLLARNPNHPVLRKIADELGIPPHAPLNEQLGRLRKRYFFTMQQVRDVVASLMKKRKEEKKIWQ